MQVEGPRLRGPGRRLSNTWPTCPREGDNPLGMARHRTLNEQIQQKQQIRILEIVDKKLHLSPEGLTLIRAMWRAPKTGVKPP